MSEFQGFQKALTILRSTFLKNHPSDLRMYPKSRQIILNAIQKGIEQAHLFECLSPLQRKPFDIDKYLPINPDDASLYSGDKRLVETNLPKRTEDVLNISKVTLKHYTSPIDTKLCGSTIQDRMRESGDVPLDGSDMQALYEEPGHTTLNLWHEVAGVSWFSAFGTIAYTNVASLSVLFLYRDWKGQWHIRYMNAGCTAKLWGDHSPPFAVLVSEK